MKFWNELNKEQQEIINKVFNKNQLIIETKKKYEIDIKAIDKYLNGDLQIFYGEINNTNCFPLRIKAKYLKGVIL